MQTSHLVLLGLVLFVACWIAATAVFSVLASRRHPPIGRFLEIDGVRLHYVERGSEHDRVLVLLHGNGMMLQDFVIGGVVGRAADHYRVLCFDRPGFGHSTRPRGRIWTPEAQADLFAAALRKLGVRQAVVLGHSWGTLVAVALGLRFPDLVQGTVLAAGYYFPTWRNDVWVLTAPALPVIGDLLRYTISPVLAWLIMPKLLRKLFAPRPVPQRFSREFPVALAVRPGHLRAGAEETALL